MTSGLLKNNPVIVLGMALPFVIVPTLTLKNGVMMSFIIFAATVPAALVAPLLRNRLPMLYRVMFFAVLSMLFVMGAALLLTDYPVQLDALGIYLPLAALNSMMLDLCVMRPRQTVIAAAVDSVMMCLGFALVACGISAVREVLSARTIWDIPFGVYPIRVVGVTMPFFGFILIGFLNALCRSIDRAMVRGMLSRGAQQQSAPEEGALQKAGDGR